MRLKAMPATALKQREDIDFMSETAAAAMQGPPAYSHAIVWSTFAFIGAFITWAAFANIGETTVGDLQHLQRLVLDAPVERPVTLRVLRQGKEVPVAVTITEAPAERPGAS